jgi:hypothetical protein
VYSGCGVEGPYQRHDPILCPVQHRPVDPANKSLAPHMPRISKLHKNF